MCRNIKPLFNFEPPATNVEIDEASLQFVRKISGFGKPSEANKAVFDHAVGEIAIATQKLLNGLVTNSEPKNRTIEAEKARKKNAKRFGSRLD